MNVLVIGTTDIVGGAAKVSWDIRSALLSGGHSVSMFVADKRSDDTAVKVIPRHYWQKIIGLAFATDNFISTDWLLETPEFKAADIVHCHNLHGRYFNLATLQKMSELKPVVWTLHDEWAITPHCAYTLEGTKLKNGLYVCPSLSTQPRLLWDNTAKIAKERLELYTKAKLHIITPSDWLKNRVLKTSLGKQDVRLIPNGIDTTVFSPTKKATAREKLGLPQEKTIIMFLATAGKANTWKGWRYTKEVLDSLTADSDVVFLNVGGFTEETDTEANVIYRTHVNDPVELALYYSAADLLLFTSIADNFPLVILEAMSCGLPIVAFEVGGVSEVLTHKENGFVAGYKNTADLIEGVVWVRQLNAIERESLAQRSREKICTHYTTKHMTDAYTALYNELL
jgi:glycosyltransferase involved in cell wall biosynthesis